MVVVVFDVFAAAVVVVVWVGIGVVVVAVLVILCSIIGFVTILLKARHEELIIRRTNK